MLSAGSEPNTAWGLVSVTHWLEFIEHFLVLCWARCPSSPNLTVWVTVQSRKESHCECYGMRGSFRGELGPAHELPREHLWTFLPNLVFSDLILVAWKVGVFVPQKSVKAANQVLPGKQGYSTTVQGAREVKVRERDLEGWRCHLPVVLKHWLR